MTKIEREGFIVEATDRNNFVTGAVLHKCESRVDAYAWGRDNMGAERYEMANGWRINRTAHLILAP